MCQVVRQQAMQRMMAMEAPSANVETRADVCEDCRFMRRREPLTCMLVRRMKGGKLEPCPQLLAAKLATPGAICPSPEKEVAQKWRAAALVAAPAELTRRAAAAVADEQVSAGKGSADIPHRPRRGIAKQPFYVY